ncbi:MAG: hypothetical protein H2212_12720 [Ruminococcus sp.]|nr:hypothetical protein [Ruminococcus sp.]
MKERTTDVDSFMDFLNEYGILCRKYWEVKKCDSYWEQLIEEVGLQYKKYPGEFEKKLLVLLMEELSRREKKLGTGSGKEQIEKPESVLPPCYEKMLTDAYRMINRMKNDSMMRKVYSDVNFYKVVDEIEGHKQNIEDLAVADSLFQEGA